MLYFNRINVSEGIDVNKTSKSKECDICLYWGFLNKDFKFQANLLMSMTLVILLNIRGANYCCIFSEISKRVSP